MNETPKVSVIIPTYNRSHTIERAITSILNQTLQDFEIIVVDDGSRDDTMGVLDRLPAARIRSLHHQHNLGPAAARNTGIGVARGEYVAFLDSDDEWLPEKLSEQVDQLQGAPDGVYANCTGLYLHQLDVKTTIERIPRPPVCWFKQLLTGCDLCPGTTLVANRSSFEKIGLFDEELPRYEDWDWLLRYVKEYPLEVIEKPLARVYKAGRPGGLPMERSADHFVAKHASDLRSLGSYHRREVIARLLLRVSEAYYGEGRRGKGSAFLFKALMQNPVQRVGMYLQVADALLGTSLAPRASRLKRRHSRCPASSENGSRARIKS